VWLAFTQSSKRVRNPRLLLRFRIALVLLRLRYYDTRYGDGSFTRRSQNWWRRLTMSSNFSTFEGPQYQVGAMTLLQIKHIPWL
jgi:hypothetical protein